jgi:hypothetical protein
MPVHKLDAFGQETNSFRGAPCIDLSYSFNHAVPRDGGIYIDGLRQIRALLDTGADTNLLDSNLFPSHVHPVEHIISVGVTGQETAANYDVTLYLREFDLVQTTGVLAMKPQVSRPFQMILGRKFLQTTRFVFDGRRGLSELEFVENPEAV